MADSPPSAEYPTGHLAVRPTDLQTAGVRTAARGGRDARRCAEGSQDPRGPGRDHADRCARAGRPRPRGRDRDRRRDRLVHPRRGVRRRGRQDPARRGLGLGRGGDGAEGEGAGGRGVPPDAGGADPVHLPAPGRGQAADHRAAGPQGDRDRVRDGAAALGCAAAAVPDVGGRGLPGAAGRGALADEGPGRARGADGRCRRGRERQGRHHRRRCLGPERREHRARDGRRRHPARHRPGQAADVVLALQQPGPRPGQQQARDRAAGDGGRPGHRRGADPRCRGPEAGLQRPGREDEARQRAGRHRHRPGRLLRGLPRHHPRRPDLPGPRLDLLLRGQHARRGPQHLHLRADQRHPALRGRPGRQGLGPGLPRGPLPRPRPQHPRRPAHQRPRRPGRRHRVGARGRGASRTG